MAHAFRPRRSMVLALLATTAAASLLGACSQTGKLFSRDSGSEAVQMTAAEAAGATSKWAAAYSKNPQDPEMALGYAKTLRAIGSKDRSLEILKTAYRANPNNGEVAAELGRVALDMGRLDIAAHALKSAESQSVTDWKTLSAQGTLHARKGQHGEAQQYFLAALQQKPDSVSVINNLALSYALDGKAAESEELLKKAVASGNEDQRVRQNLALVLGLQGKFDEARQVAAVDMTEAQAKSSMAYLRNMLSSPTQVAEAASATPSNAQASAEDWSPFASNAADKEAPKVQTAANAAPAPQPPKVQMVTPVDEIEPAKIAQAQTAKAPGQKSSAKPAAPTQIAPANLLRAGQ
ncbi:MAG: tetratricopeptide repeat protein [Methyloceanibacter sp.]|uniref:tetratricopeptide repeat protein n=1 Tax=Methyloceanibacter sp. TaxID=1965321 RepID=UPI003D6D9EEE